MVKVNGIGKWKRGNHGKAWKAWKTRNARNEMLLSARIDSAMATRYATTFLNEAACVPTPTRSLANHSAKVLGSL